MHALRVTGRTPTGRPKPFHSKWRGMTACKANMYSFSSFHLPLRRRPGLAALNQTNYPSSFCRMGSYDVICDRIRNPQAQTTNVTPPTPATKRWWDDVQILYVGGWLYCKRRDNESCKTPSFIAGCERYIMHDILSSQPCHVLAFHFVSTVSVKTSILKRSM